MERTHEAPSNEAPHMILGYHQGRLVMYLQNNLSVRFLVDGGRLSPEPAYRFCNFNSFLFLFSSGATQDCGSTSLALAMVVSTTFSVFIWNLEVEGQLLLSILSIPLVRINWSVFCASDAFYITIR